MVPRARLQPSGRRLGALVAVSLAVAWGLAAGWWTPRGPLTSSAAIWSIVISLAVGVAAGFAVRSRWAMLLAPVAFAAAFELTRLRVDGPMVDGIHASFYGAIALVTGRGFHALLTLLPMALGAAVGAGVARSRAGERGTASPRPARVLRRTGAVIAARRAGGADRRAGATGDDRRHHRVGRGAGPGLRRRAHHGGPRRPRPGPDDPRHQHRQPGPALPRRRPRRLGARRDATPPARAREALHRRHLGPARSRHLLRRAGPDRHRHPRRLRLRHHRAHQLPARPVRHRGHLPARPVLGNHARRARRAAAAASSTGPSSAPARWSARAPPTRSSTTTPSPGRPGPATTAWSSS